MIGIEVNTRPLVDFDPFAGNAIEKVVPTTEPQKEIFASCILGGTEANLAYNESLSLDFTGSVQVRLLMECLSELVLRHESLRASFSGDGSKMMIYASQPLQIHQEDISTLEPSAQQAALQTYHRQDAETAFDLLDGPLIRFALFILSRNRYLLTISAHHIVCDGWSFGILLEDLSKLYNAGISGAPLPDRPIQFSDYALYSATFQQSPEYKATVDYWKREYEGDIPVFEIPPDYQRPPVRTYKSRRDDFVLPAATAAAIKKAGAKYGSSFVNTLMAAFEVLLYKYTGHQDIVIGLPTAGQAATEMYDLIGHCVNLLPLRSQPNPDLSFAEYLKQRKSKTLRDYEHQQFTFGTFLKELKIPRDPSRMPLVPVSFNIDMGMDMQVSFKDLDYQLLHNKRVAETFELFLNIADCEEGYVFQWSYNAQLYRPATIKSLMDKYRYLLLQIADNATQKIADLQLVDKTQLLADLQKWNGNFKKLPEGSVIDLWNKSTDQYPDRVAVIFREEQLTYKALNDRVNQLYALLLKEGIQKGDIIGIALNRGAWLPAALLAVLKCGAVYVPIDTALPASRIQFMLEDAGIKALITSQLLADQFADVACKVFVEQTKAADNRILPVVKQEHADSAYILYTSGSTGIPKGVEVSHGNLVNLLTAMQSMFQTSKDLRLLSVTTISFDIVGVEMYLPLICGGQLILTTDEQSKNGHELLRLLQEYRVNFFQATPATYKILLEAGWKEKMDGIMITCGEPLAKSLADRVLPKCTAFYNMYGPTETTIYSTGTRIQGNEDPITIGRPIQNTSVYIIDKNGNLLPANIAGEICIAGDGVAKGYYHRPDLTAEKFVADPFSGHPGNMFKTGDIGRFTDDGDIVYLGRKDDQVKLRGYRIEPGEIDHYLSGMRGIKNSITVVREDEPGNGYLAAYVVLQEAGVSSELLKKEWKEALSSKLPDYMVPRIFMILDTLPLTGSGKVDKKQLPAPEFLTREYTAPETSEELLLAGIWEEVFNRKQVGVYDNFFELGGHSLLAVRMIRMLEDKTGVSMEVTSVFRYPVLRDLVAEYMRNRGIADIVEEDEDKWYLPANGNAPLSFAATEGQLEIWQECLIGGTVANISYNLSHAEYLNGPLNVDLLRQALQELMNRHELLNATFEEGGAMVHIHTGAALPFSYEDISNKPVEEQQVYIREFLKQQRETPFDLEKGLLFNAAVLKLEERRYCFSLVIHHLICDGTSFDVLLREIGQLYNNYRSGIIQNLDQPVRFSAYAQKQQQLYQSPNYKKDIDYWVAKFEKEVPVLELPLDYPYPATRSYKSTIEYYSINKATTALIEKLAAGCNSTLTILLRVLFDVLIYKYTEQKEFVVGLPVSDSINVAGFSMIGHNVNMLPVKSVVTAEMSFRDYLKQRNVAVMEDYDHRLVTFGTLIKKIRVKRSSIRNTLVSVSFGSQMDKQHDTLNLDGIQHEVISNREGYDNLELSIDTVKKDGALHFQVIYSSDLFKPATIKELMDRFMYLQSQVMQDPDQPIEQLQLEDRKALTTYWQNWNNRSKILPGPATIIEKINATCLAHPDRAAVYCKGQSLSYREIYERSNQMAHYLVASGMLPGGVVGIAMERGVELIVSILGVLKAGGIFLPLDPQYARERIEYMISNSGAQLLLTSALFAGKLQTEARELCVQDLDKELSGQPVTLPDIPVTAASLVYILYTSGSTGRPKGVMIANGSLVNYISWAVDYYLKGAAAVFPLYTSISFDLTITSIFSPLVSGSLLKIYDEEDPSALLGKIFTDPEVNVIKLTPSHLRLVKDSGYIRNNLPGQRLRLIVGGEDLETALAKEVYDLCSGNVEIYNEYGPTEATVGCVIHEYTPDEQPPSVPIGVPISNARIYLLDSAFQLVPKGVNGEIFIGGDCVARGYYRNAELTEDRFLEDPFVPGGRMYKTGDNAVMLENDVLLFKGRIDDQVKLRGYRIEPGEIDYHLSGLTDIQSAVTIVREDSPGKGYLASYVVLQDKEAPPEQLKKKWREALRSKLPDYMVPGVFVILEELPLTGNGKIDKRALPTPVFDTKPRKEPVGRPLSALENQVKQIWEEELGIQQLSLSDDFFELGGHSLTAIKIMTRIKNETGVNLPISTLFEHSTLAAVIGLLQEENEIEIGKKVLVPIKTTGTRPPIYLIHGGALNILLYKQLEPFLDEEQPLYGIQALGLDGDLSYLGSIEEIAARYLAEVLAQNPDGPYIIIGYSYGGIVAYEMTRQLLAMGKTVQLLGIMDTNVSNFNPPDGKKSLFLKKTGRQFKKALFIGKNLLRYPKDVVAYQWLIFNRKFNKHFREEPEEQVYDYDTTVMEAYDNAYCNYKMAPLNIVIHLFRVQERIYFVDDPLYLGWKKYASGGVVVHDVAGDHKTFLLPPNNKKLMSIIQKCIK